MQPFQSHQLLGAGSAAANGRDESVTCDSDFSRSSFNIFFKIHPASEPVKLGAHIATDNLKASHRESSQQVLGGLCPFPLILSECK